MSEVLTFPEGKIFIAQATPELSIGLLVLNPQTRLPRHNRPVDEQLTQITGRCQMIIEEKGSETILLSPNNTLSITAGTFHAHTNPFDQPSITLWKFEGDITEIINDLRKKYSS